MTRRPSIGGTLTASVELTGGRVVLRVRGEVDHFTAPGLGAILETVVDRSQPSVVVDLTDCLFMDSAGLKMIAERAAYLRVLGTTLTIRSPSPTLRRLASVMGLAELIESGELDQASERSRSVLASPSGKPADLPRRMSPALLYDEFVDSTLRLVVTLAQSALGGADGASVSLRRRGVLTTVAATDQTVSAMDVSQYATKEGPCIDASTHGRPYHTESLGTERRWPTFTPSARTLGIKAILSSPLFDRDQPCGALNIYSRHIERFVAADRTLASMIASETSTVLADVWMDTSDEQLWGRLLESLKSREAIARAEGVLMERDGTNSDDAFDLLRRSSMLAGTSLREQAAIVIATTGRRRFASALGTEKHIV